MPPPSAEPDSKAVNAFEEAVADDLNMPKALAVLWDTVDKEATPSRAAAIFEMDRILGLDLASARARLSDRRVLRGGHGAKEQEAMKLAIERQQSRKAKDFARADELRDKIKDMGFAVEDTPEGPRLKPLDPS